MLENLHFTKVIFEALTKPWLFTMSSSNLNLKKWVPNSVLNSHISSTDSKVRSVLHEHNSMNERKNTDIKETNTLKKFNRISSPGAKLNDYTDCRGTFYTHTVCSDCSMLHWMRISPTDANCWKHLVHTLLLLFEWFASQNHTLQ